MKDKLKVAVLMGGIAGERVVSLKSGRSVAEALQEAGHRVEPYEVDQRGLPGLRALRPDAVFIALHGPFGEDGGVQRLLEKMNLPYTGSGPRASCLGMNKLVSKRLFVRHSIPTPDYFTVDPREDAGVTAERAAEFGYPLVCKPIASGSSLGVTMVGRPEELPHALREARRESRVVLVESYIRGRELTVGLLQGEALPVVEVVAGREFFDYQAKYEDPNTRYVTPVSLLPTIYRKLTRAAVRAYRALGCRHMARVDMMYGYDGQLGVLEVNTIPGFTPRSLLPVAAAEAGISFPALCDRLVRAAVRARGRERRKTA